MQVFKKKKQPSKRDHVSIYSIDVTTDLIIMAKRELPYSSPSFSFRKVNYSVYDTHCIDHRH